MADERLSFYSNCSSPLVKLATKRPLSVGERVPHLFAHPALWVHLMAHLHVVGVVHDILDHVFEHSVAREDRVDLGTHVV